MPLGNFSKGSSPTPLQKTITQKPCMVFCFTSSTDNCNIYLQTELHGIFPDPYSAAARKEKIASERQVSHEALYLENNSRSSFFGLFNFLCTFSQAHQNCTHSLVKRLTAVIYEITSADSHSSAFTVNTIPFLRIYWFRTSVFNSARLDLLAPQH